MKIGSGSSCVVYKRGKHAVKSYYKDIILQSLIRDVYFLSILDPEYIVRFISAYQFRGAINIKMELYGLSLYDLAELDSASCKRLKLDYIIPDIYNALVYLHSQGILHRDVSPSNILVLNGKAKLCDLGNACYCREYSDDIVNELFRDTSPVKSAKSDYYSFSRSIDYYTGTIYTTYDSSGYIRGISNYKLYKSFKIGLHYDPPSISKSDILSSLSSDLPSYIAKDISGTLCGEDIDLSEEHLYWIKKVRFKLVENSN